MNTLGRAVLMKNPRFSHLKRQQREGKKKKDALNHYMEKNQNV
jgi:hypothetical protein